MLESLGRVHEGTVGERTTGEPALEADGGSRFRESDGAPVLVGVAQLGERHDAIVEAVGSRPTADFLGRTDGGNGTEPPGAVSVPEHPTGELGERNPSAGEGPGAHAGPPASSADARALVKLSTGRTSMRLRLLTKLLNLLCSGTITRMTSVSGEVVVHICDGWCGMWVIDTNIGHARGWRWTPITDGHVGAIAKALRDDGHFEAANEVEKLYELWDTP